MKWVTFKHQGLQRIGCHLGAQIVDLNYAYRAQLESEGVIRAAAIAEAYIPANMVEFLQGGDDSRERAKQAVEFAQANSSNYPYPIMVNSADVTLEAPVQQPGKILCVGQNYRDHIAEMKREIPPFPVIFSKYANTLLGDGAAIPLYPFSSQLDYELELTVVIGKRARNVAQEDALNYIAGYTIGNDVTYRDIQRRTSQWTPGKSVDGSAPMGPWIVSSDELPDPASLEVSLTVNGEERQRSNTAHLIFSIPYLISFLSELMTLEPGDLIMSGTPDGVGFARNPQTFLRDGDIVRLEIERIGTLQNTVRTTSLPVNR